MRVPSLPSLLLLPLLLPAAQGCVLDAQDARGDQEPPFPAAQYDVHALTAASGDGNLSLALRVEAAPEEASTVQYHFNFRHDRWRYFVPCPRYTVDLGARPVACHLSRVEDGTEAGAAAFERVADLPDVEVDAEGIRVRIPYDLFGAAGQPVDSLRGSTQFSVSDQGPAVYPTSGSVSPAVVDEVLASGALVLCGPVADEGPDADAGAPPQAQRTDDEPSAGAVVGVALSGVAGVGLLLLGVLAARRR